MRVCLFLKKEKTLSHFKFLFPLQQKYHQVKSNKDGMNMLSNFNRNQARDGQGKGKVEEGPLERTKNKEHIGGDGERERKGRAGHGNHTPAFYLIAGLEFLPFEIPFHGDILVRELTVEGGCLPCGHRDILQRPQKTNDSGFARRRKHLRITHFVIPKE